ncbi:MAG: urocanate hydratase, partial [Bacteroidota bacterium]|nr:urocanate hydratase [Bacteroidota bacterium]
MTNLKQSILQGIPDKIPAKKERNPNISHAPHRKDILNQEEKQLAIRNALRYFPKHMHATLAPEFAQELKTYGRIYMYRFMPDYEIKARPLDDFPYKSKQAAGIQLMLSNNLDNAIAQHPEELITY